MKLSPSKALLLFNFSLLIISGCSGITFEPVDNYSTHFMCFNQDKSEEHYFTNIFVLVPTAEQKQYELLLGKLRMEKQLQIKLIDCREIAESELPDNLDISSPKV